MKYFKGDKVRVNHAATRQYWNMDAVSRQNAWLWGSNVEARVEIETDANGLTCVGIGHGSVISFHVPDNCLTLIESGPYREWHKMNAEKMAFAGDMFLDWNEEN